MPTTITGPKLNSWKFSFSVALGHCTSLVNTFSLLHLICYSTNSTVEVVEKVLLLLNVPLHFRLVCVALTIIPSKFVRDKLIA